MPQADTILKRKLSAAQPAAAAVETGAKAWKTAFARAARDRVGLDLSVASVSDDRRSLSEVLDLLPEQSLLVVLEGPEQSLGLIVLSPVLLASVIEVQTIGRLSPSAPLARRPTRTDAAMAAPMIDAALAGLELALMASTDLVWTAGYRYASFLDEPRPLALLLEDLPYRVLSCQLELEHGTRQGQALLALPAEGRGPRPLARVDHTQSPQVVEWKNALESAVTAAEITLDAVIGRLSMSLGQAKSMQPGMVFSLKDSHTDDIALIGPDRQKIAVARLGQHRGLRAVKIEPTAAPTSPPILGVIEGDGTTATAPGIPATSLARSA